MRSGLVLLAFACALRAETGSFSIHMILHAIGEERYEIAPADGGLSLSTTFEYSDRGNKRTTTANMNLKSDYTPLNLKIQGRPGSIVVDGANVTVTEDSGTRSFPAPARYAAVLGPSSFAVQLMTMRYWLRH